MKIGILTFHCAHNYGAVLQCYALQEVLKGMGHSVEIIDYRPDYLRIPYDVISLRRIWSCNPLRLAKRIISEILSLPQRILRHRKFEQFINRYLNLSESTGISSDYDVYVMGSDQIWNSKITKGFDNVYFGYFSFSKGNKKYMAYAASMETESLDRATIDYMRKALNNFDAISVRETHLAYLLQPLTNKTIQVVLDPTLLADSNIWNAFIDSNSPLKERYILAYQIQSDKDTLRTAEYIARQLKAKVLILSYLPACFQSKNLYQTESPKSFVNLIKHASCVVTRSFHGIAFSIILNRPFYCIYSGNGDTRSISLLSLLDLRERMIEKDTLPIFQKIDYQRVNRILDETKKKSLGFFSCIQNC